MKAEQQTERFFYAGDQIEFYNDGDRCEILRTFNLRGVRKVEYRSVKTGKKYCDNRHTLIALERNDDLKYFSKS